MTLEYRYSQYLLLFFALFNGCLLVTSSLADDDKLKKLAEGIENEGDAGRIARELQANPDTRLLDVLAAMKDKSAVAKNWYLAVAQTVADRDPAETVRELTQFLPRLSEDSTARFWAFTYLTRGKPELRDEMLESMLADPSLDLRYEAVELGMKRLSEAQNASQDQRLARYRELLVAARQPAQIQAIAEQLEELGSPVNLLELFGFVADWQMLGTFDNVGQAGFEVEYEPEKDYIAGNLDFKREYSGKSGEAVWKTAKTEEPDGSVNLNPIFADEKGAIVYALGEFQAPSELECEVRIGSPNGCKVWVNGNLSVSREVYHTGNQIDQYVEPVKLHAGKNSILVKVCQNEQTDSWAQDWLFQLRFTDSTGLAIQPAE